MANEDYKSIIIGFATNLLGIIVTVSFVQHLFDKQQNKQDKTEERNKILRYNKVMGHIIEEYICYYNIIFSSLEGRNEINSTSFKESIHFSDMKYLYYTSNVIRDSFFRSAIESFFEIEKELIDYCYLCIWNIDFKYYSELGETILDLIIKSKSFDCRDAILKNKDISINGQTAPEYYRDLIADELQNWVERYDAGLLFGSLIVPYVLLFKCLTVERELISKYLELIKSIKQEDYSFVR